jgi:hypothetical protein
VTQGLVIARLLHIPPADSPTITNKTSPHFAEALGADQIDADRQATEPAARVDHTQRTKHSLDIAASWPTGVCSMQCRALSRTPVHPILAALTVSYGQGKRRIARRSTVDL